MANQVICKCQLENYMLQRTSQSDKIPFSCLAKRNEKKKVITGNIPIIPVIWDSMHTEITR